MYEILIENYIAYVTYLLIAYRKMIECHETL